MGRPQVLLEISRTLISSSSLSLMASFLFSLEALTIFSFFCTYSVNKTDDARVIYLKLHNEMKVHKKYLFFIFLN